MVLAFAPTQRATAGQSLEKRLYSCNSFTPPRTCLHRTKPRVTTCTAACRPETHMSAQLRWPMDTRQRCCQEPSSTCSQAAHLKMKPPRTPTPCSLHPQNSDAPLRTWPTAAFHRPSYCSAPASQVHAGSAGRHSLSSSRARLHHGSACGEQLGVDCGLVLANRDERDV